MPDFMEQRRLARLLDRAADQARDLEAPNIGWIAAMRRALGMSAEQVAVRKGVTRNAVYQAERNELDGAVSLNQMDRLAKAMGGKFVYAIIPDGRIEDMKYHRARALAEVMLQDELAAPGWSADERQDWLDDKAAELLHDMPATFWDYRVGTGTSPR